MTLRVLLADDDALVLRLTASVLREGGYEVTTVESGHQARVALSEENFDVVIADLFMPGNHELEFLRDQATSDRFLPVIVITGQPSLDTAVEALRLGVVDYVVKPVSAALLFGAIARAVEKRDVVRALRSAEDRMSTLSASLEDLRRAIDATARAPEAFPPPSRPLLSGLSDEERDSLSPRELDVLTTFARGLTAREVAEELGLATNTVRNHMKSIYLKLGVNSQVALLGKVIRHPTR